jgi:hypothetical protein
LFLSSILSVPLPYPSVYSLAGIERFVTSLLGDKLDGLSISQAQKPGKSQALVQQAVNSGRQRVVEIDHDVSAENHVEVVKGSVGHQVVLGEDDVLAEGVLENDVVVSGGVILRERTGAAGLKVIAGVLSQERQGKDAALGSGQDAFIHVRGVDPALGIKPFFPEKNGHGVDLFSGGAAYVPKPEEGVVAQFRNHPCPKGAIKIRVAKHGGHVDRDLQQEALHDCGIVEELPLQLGDTVSLLLIHALPDPALERRVGVIAKIEPIAAKHGLQEKLDLQGLKVVSVRR